MAGVRFHFDPDQAHQREAIDAVVDALASVGDRRARLGAVGSGVVSQGEPLDLGRLLLDVRRVQARAGLPLSEAGEGAELTVEMETGTGKTYAYLRLMRELYARYGLSRFIVVVPGVAIRCGVLEQLGALEPHLRGLFPDQRVEAAVFDPAQPGAARRFARDSGLQILVMNIDAFNKGRANLAHRPSDALGGETPVALLAATRPVVVLDEPQSMEGPRARAALAELGALVTLRWSATHRRAPHRVYRLDPVRAFALGLVKRVDVAAVSVDGGVAAAVTLVRTRATQRGVAAELSVLGPDGPVAITARGEGEDLFLLSGGVEACRGLRVEAVDHGAGEVRLSSGAVLTTADAPEVRAAVWRAQLTETVESHLERELACRRLLPAGERMKVLSLVFLDRVDDYAPASGPVRAMFTAAWESARGLPRFAELGLPAADAVCRGYFAKRRGEAIDSTGKTREDDEAYQLIMADKARLLSPDEPVRFVFSHSALREGWDNPNVFQICTLRRTKSELKKRQELGRGMRLPVLESGRRTHDPDLARLTVVANSSYEAFARELQRETIADAAVDYSACITDRSARRFAALRPGWRQIPDFAELWRRIATPQRFVPAVDDIALQQFAVSRLREAVASAPSFQVRVERGSLSDAGAPEGSAAGARQAPVASSLAAAPAPPAEAPVPDPLQWLQAETGLTRATLAGLIDDSELVEALVRAPSATLELAAQILSSAVRDATARAGDFAPCAAPLAPEVLEHRPLALASSDAVPVQRSPYLELPASSAAERQWLRAVDAAPETLAILPWPAWLAAASPLGPVAPRWAVARRGPSGAWTLTLIASPGGDPGGAAPLAALARSLGAALEQAPWSPPAGPSRM
jgi:type III restriction enzyme